MHGSDREAARVSPPGKALQIAAVVSLLGFLVINCLVQARTDTPTVDEFVYLPAGYYHLRTGDLTFDSTNHPFLKMACSPKAFQPLIAEAKQLKANKK